MCAETEYSTAFGVWPCGWEWTFGKLRSTMYAGVTFEWGKDACNPSKAHGDDWRCIWPWLFVDMKFIEVPRYVHIIGYDRMWSLWCCECCATFWNVYSGFDDFCDRLGQHGGRSASTLAASYRPAMACKPESKGCRFKSLSRQGFCFSLKIVESCFCQIWGISAEINFKISKIFQNCWSCLPPISLWGNCMLASAFVGYASPFSARLRQAKCSRKLLTTLRFPKISIGILHMICTTSRFGWEIPWTLISAFFGWISFEIFSWTLIPV